MRSTWQGKAGRSPLQALYESDQVKGQGEGDGGGGGEEGVGCWRLTPSSTPPVFRALQCVQTHPRSPYLNLWLCPKEKTTPLWGVIVDKKLLLALAGIWANGFIIDGLSHSWANVGDFTI